MRSVMLNGGLSEAGKALVSVEDRGFRYGDGAFETLRVHAGVPTQWEWHLDRLSRGLSAIRIAFDTAVLQPQCARLLKENGVLDGLLRIQITRGAGSRGYLPAPIGEGPTVVIETPPLPPFPEGPIALWQSRWRKISPAALPVQSKLCQGLNSTLARMEAQDNHCADALQLNENGELCETASSNLFWLKDGALYTPALACGPLEGSTRAAILRLSPYPVSEVCATIDALATAEAVCMTNAVWKALAVGALKPAGFGWHSEKLAAELRELLTQDAKRYTEKHRAAW